jgi:protein SCO1/2
MSSGNQRPIQWIVWGFLGVIILGICFAYVGQRFATPELPIYGQIRNFTLTNQNGQVVAFADLQGKVWVANVIFTSCAGPCPKLTHQMEQVQAAFPETVPVRFISLTADPATDTPPVLRQYGSRFHANPARWFFLTGKKSDVYAFATQELKFTVIDNGGDRKSDEDQFIHTEKFAVLDRRGRIRSYIDGDEPQTVPKLTRAVEILLKEKD